MKTGGERSMRALEKRRRKNMTTARGKKKNKSCYGKKKDGKK